MSGTLFLLSIVFATLGSILKKLDKIIALIVVILLTFAFGNVPSSIPDYLTYQASYLYGESASAVNFEYGYKIIENIGNLFGLSYIEFREIIGFVGFFILYCALKKFRLNKISFVLLIYSITTFIIDISQVRNFLMMSFVLFGFSAFINDNNFRYIKLLTFILLGASFQKLGYIFLLFFIVKICYAKAPVRYATGIAVIFGTLLAIIPAVRSMLASSVLQILISDSSQAMKIQNYLGVQTRAGFVLYWIVIITSWACCFMSYKDGYSDDVVTNYAFKVKQVYLIFMVAVASLPLILFNVEFYRVFRDLFLIVLMGNFLSISRSNNVNYKICAIGLIMFMIFMHLYLVVEPIIQSNLITLFYS